MPSRPQAAPQALLKQLEPMLDSSALTVTGRTLGENLDGVVGSQPRRHQAARPAVLATLRRSSCSGVACSRERDRQTGPASPGTARAVRPGEAIVYDGVPEAIDGIQKGELTAGASARASRVRTEGWTGDGGFCLACRVRDLCRRARERRGVRDRRAVVWPLQQRA